VAVFNRNGWPDWAGIRTGNHAEDPHLDGIAAANGAAQAAIEALNVDIRRDACSLDVGVMPAALAKGN
jgi:hypothetical protein